MKKSELYTLTMQAVVKDTTLSAEMCMEIINELAIERNVAVICERIEAEKA